MLSFILARHFRITVYDSKVYDFDLLPDRLREKTFKEVSTGCWLWYGYVSKTGYGTVGFETKYWRVHRLSYKMLKSSLDPTKVIDHLCKTRNCINPSHLEQVTQGENARRGDHTNKGTHPNTGKATGALNKAKTHCPKNHPYKGTNLIISNRTGARSCRICQTKAKAEWYQKNKN